MFLHKLRHVQADEALRRVEQVLGQLLDQLRLAHAGAAYKDEAHRLVLGGDAHPVAADGGGDGGNGLVLAHNLGLEPLVQLAEALELLLPDLAGRDLRPQLDYPGQVLHGQLGLPLGGEAVQLRLELHLPALDLRQALKVGLLRGLQHLPLLGVVRQLPADLLPPVDIGVLQVHIGAGLVDKVNGLVRQEAVRDVPLAEHHRLAQDALRDRHPVEALVVVGNAPEDLHGVLQVGLVHRHGLEPALQGGVLLDVLAVLGEGGGANDLDLPPAQGGLEDVGGVHAALGVPGAHDVVDLVNHQDDVSALADLLNEALHAALELAPELGASHQGGEIQQVDLPVPQLEGHVPLGDALGQALGDGGLAHAGLADEAGVVLLPAVQDLDHPLDLLLPAHQTVQLPGAGPLGEVDAVAVQILPLGGFVALALLGLVAAGGLGRRLPAAGGAVEQAVEEGEGGGLAVLALVLLVVPGDHALHGLRAAEGVHHLVGDGVQILVGDAHAAHHIVHLGQAQVLGAPQAQALVDGLALLNFGDEDHGYPLLASRTQGRLHNFLPPWPAAPYIRWFWKGGRHTHFLVSFYIKMAGL